MDISWNSIIKAGMDTNLNTTARNRGIPRWKQNPHPKRIVQAEPLNLKELFKRVLADFRDAVYGALKLDYDSDEDLEEVD